jgi:hypothetical protein
LDLDFKADPETLTVSKFIYAITSVDAHGLISNYSSQFEVTFDFLKNQLVKKIISNSGAPRAYPNMYLMTDTFKDVIKTSGGFSKKMKIYFMPDYLKLGNQQNGIIQKMVETKQSDSFYKIQFINLQNQKSDSIKIKIDDSNDFMNRVL